MQLQIKITGSGTKEQILSALRAVTRSIQDEEIEALAEGKEFEDNTLMSEVSEDMGG